MASGVYTRGALAIANGTIDPETSTIKAMLLEAGYTFNPDHEFVDEAGTDVLSAEASGTGYAAGGWGGASRKTLASKTLVVDDTGNLVKLTFDPIVWSGINCGTIVAMVLIVEGVADDTTSRLISFHDIADVVTNGGDLTITLGSNGAIRWLV